MEKLRSQIELAQSGKYSKMAPAIQTLTNSNSKKSLSRLKHREGIEIEQRRERQNSYKLTRDTLGISIENLNGQSRIEQDQYAKQDQRLTLRIKVKCGARLPKKSQQM